jgi:hypothetical protein
MLQFNLSKPDRVVLHKRIASTSINPKEISLMSSTDLANEETKQSIKIAEKESLEHSILQKTKVPRAKITHKGLQDIEDMNGETRVEPELENDQEEERRERERMARLRAVQEMPLSPTSTVGHSVPPESPVQPPTSSWGGPPVATTHTAHASDSDMSPVFPRPPVNPMFMHTTSDFAMAEPELNLADLINIDEDPPTQDGSAPAPSPTMENSPTMGATTNIPAGSSPRSPTGISPFAASTSRPEPLSRSSFDLNSLWSAPKVEPPPPAIPPIEDQKQNFADNEIVGEEANDQDFDMFLEKDQDENSHTAGANKSADVQQSVFDGLPQVWTGMVCLQFGCAAAFSNPYALSAWYTSRFHDSPGDSRSCSPNGRSILAIRLAAMAHTISFRIA